MSLNLFTNMEKMLVSYYVKMKKEFPQLKNKQQAGSCEDYD